MFEVIENEEPAKKLVKRDLALRYLDLHNASSSSILKCTQLAPVLDLLSSYFASHDDSTKVQLGFDNLNEPNQKLILSILNNLIKSILKPIKPEDITSYCDILAKTVKILSALVKTSSTKFIDLVYSEPYHELIDNIFDLAIQIEIKTNDSESLGLIEADYKSLLTTLVHLSGGIERNETIWSSEKLKKLIDRFKPIDNLFTWYLFIISERMDKDIRVGNPVLIKIVDENYIFEYNEKNSEEEQIQLRNFGLR